MTKIPLFSPSSASFLLKSKSLPPPPLFSPPTMAATHAAARPMGSSESDITKSDFPVPLTPPYPAHSKEVELRRAMSASARSGAPFELGVVFEDEWISVVNKPAGIYCDAILSSLSSSIGSNKSSFNLHLANRLDRDTSGLMVVTKQNKAAAKLVKSFTDHAVSKTYLALAVGPAPDWSRVHIKSGHGRSKHGAWRVYSVDDVDRTLPGGSRVKHMETAFEVLSINGTGAFRPPVNFDSGAKSIVVRDQMLAEEEKSGRKDDEVLMRAYPKSGGTDAFRPPVNLLNSSTDGGAKYIAVRDKMLAENKSGTKDVVLMRAYPKSGRTHQIRLHCQYFGLPIRGDVKYGGVSEWNGMECDFHALHAESLSFVHPITDVTLNFEAPLPSWVRELVPTMEG